MPRVVSVKVFVRRAGCLLRVNRVNKKVSEETDVIASAIRDFFGKKELPNRYWVEYKLNPRGKYVAYLDGFFNRMGIKKAKDTSKSLSAVCFLEREWNGKRVSRKILK